MENIELPQDLSLAIGSESRDFSVKAGHVQPLKKSLGQILGGLLWLSVITLMGYLVLGGFSSTTTQSESKTFPIVFLGIFLLVGIVIFFSGIIALFKSGGYFVGTPLRLVHYQNGNIRSIDWEQFSGEIELRGNAQKGNISLQMRTGRMVSRKGQSDRYVPDVLYITDIPDVFEVEKICRRRIKENDPTPASTGFSA